jgi:DNA-binding NarL/FixJ family response regulator
MGDFALPPQKASAGKKIRVLVADGRPLVRAGLRILLEQENDLTLVGEADKADLIVKKATSTRPQVILLDSRLGEVSGRSVLQQLHRGLPKVRLFVLSSSDKEEDQVRTLKVPSAQVVPRHTSFQALLQWVRQLDGGTPDSVAAPEGRAPSEHSPWETEPKDSSPLSSRERQVVELVSQGFKNREIAQRMFISEQTVKNHLHNIFDKLGVSDRLELALYAIHKNLQGPA